MKCTFSPLRLICSCRSLGYGYSDPLHGTCIPFMRSILQTHSIGPDRWSSQSAWSYSGWSLGRGRVLSSSCGLWRRNRDIGASNTNIIMVCHSFAPFVVLVTTFYFLQAQCSPVVFEHRGICATEDPDTSFLSALERVKTDETQPHDAGSESRNGPIEIETWFHIITRKADQDQVSDDMVDSQVSSPLNSLTSR